MTGTRLDRDAIHDLCSDKHRRIVLAVLAEQQRPLTLNDLAKTIVKHNHHVPLTEASGETITRIKTSLYHCHVPKFAEAGLIEFDAERKLVEPNAEFEQIETHLASFLAGDPELSQPVEL